MRMALTVFASLTIAFSHGATTTHTQAAQHLFLLLPPAKVVRGIYGETVTFPRPSSDVFYSAYRDTLVRQLIANYSEAELRDIAREVSESEQAGEEFLRGREQLVNIALGNAIQALHEAKPAPGEIRVLTTQQEDRGN